MASSFQTQIKKNVKKTRQGSGRGTKSGNIGSKKHYVKKYRGQGGKKMDCLSWIFVKCF